MSAPINDGGPAFPTATIAQKTEGGMTLRDYFAGQALAGILGSANASIIDKWAVATLTQSCYIIANSMLAAREATK